MDTTFRVIALEELGNVGLTARTPALAKRAIGNLRRNPDSTLLALEQTEWDERNEKPRAVRSVIVEAESNPGEWVLGAQGWSAA